MKARLAIAAALAIALVAGLFVSMAAPAKAQVTLPNGPWADRLIWSEQPDSGLALEQIKIGEGDFFMFTVQGGSQKIDAFQTPGILAFDSFGSLNGLAFNPNRQNGDDVAGQNSMNPFTSTVIREAMQFLIDRKFLVDEVLEGFGVEMYTNFIPVDADHFRELETIQGIQASYQANQVIAAQMIWTEMLSLGASLNAEGKWVDSFGDLITLTVIQRIEDERFLVGAYVAAQLEAMNFTVNLNPSPGSVAIGMVYSGAPNVGNWHVYTEGWAYSGSVAWKDGELWFFHSCVFEPWCAAINPGVGTHTVPADFQTAAETVAFGQYTSLAERQSLIRGMLPRTLSETNWRMWLTSEQSVYPVSGRIQGSVFDPVAGVWAEYVLKTAQVVPGEPGVDPATGVGGDVRVLNLIAFNDAWNPWQDDTWLYDALQRQAMGDPDDAQDPRTGLVIPYRVTATVETAGPTGTLPVPSTALTWLPGATAFTPVGTGVTAISKVTTSLGADPGKWHTGQDITMTDVIFGIAGMYRRAFGEISLHDDLAATAGLKFTLSNVVKAWEFDMAARTITLYLDFWHVDEAEIMDAGNVYMSSLEAPVPWPIQEALFQTVIDDTTAINSENADAKGAERMDLVRNPRSVAAIDVAFAAVSAENAPFGRIPLGMGNVPGIGAVITDADAQAAYASAQDFRDLWGHWYASNGPFILQSLDPTFRQTVFVAFRDGYPFKPDHWDFLKEAAVPDTAFGAFPDSLLAGSAAELSVTTTLLGQPADPNTVSWFVRQVATGAIPLRGEAIRLATGQFEVQLLSTLTVGLETGSYELVVLVQGAQGSTSQSFAFTVTSQVDFFSALFAEVQSGLTATQDQLSDLTGDVASAANTAVGNTNLILAVLALAVIAIVVPAVMLFIILRRMPPGGA